MAKLTKIERELHAAAEPFELFDDERRQVYLLRLVKAIDQLSDADFGAMSQDAQAWVESAAQAVVKKKPIRDFEPDAEPTPARRRLPKAEDIEQELNDWEAAADGAGDTAAPSQTHIPKKTKKAKAVEPEPEATRRARRGAKEEEEETAPVKPARKVRAAANGPVPKARPISRRGLLPTGRNKHIQDRLARDPNASINELIEYLQEQGFDESQIPSRITISTTRSSFRSALETMDRLKMLKKPVKLQRVTDFQDED
jgi:hypothetical protein